MDGVRGDAVPEATSYREGCTDRESDREASPSVEAKESDMALCGVSLEGVCESASTEAGASQATKRNTAPLAVLPWFLPLSVNRMITSSRLPGPQEGYESSHSAPFLRSSDGVMYLPASRLLPPPRRLRPQVEQQFFQRQPSFSSSEDEGTSNGCHPPSVSSSLAFKCSTSASPTPLSRDEAASFHPSGRAPDSPASEREEPHAETVNAFLLQRARRVQAERSHRVASTASGRPQQYLQQVLLQQQPVRRRAGLEEPSTGIAASADILGVVEQLRQVLDRLEGSEALVDGRREPRPHNARDELTGLLRPHYPTPARARSLPATTPAARQARRQRQQQQRQDLQDLRQLIFKVADLTISDPASWASATASGGSELEENEFQNRVLSPTGGAANSGNSSAGSATPASASEGNSGGAPDRAAAAGNAAGARQPAPVGAQSTAPAPTVSPASAQQNVLLFLGYGGGSLLVRTLMVRESALASDESNEWVSGAGIFAELKELLIYVKNECMYLLRELAINNMHLAAVCAWNPELMRLLFELMESPVTFDSSELLLEELVSSREGLLSARQGCPQWFQDEAAALAHSRAASRLQTSLERGSEGASRRVFSSLSGGTEGHQSFFSSTSGLRSGNVLQTNFVSRLSMRHVAVMTRLLSLLLFERDDRHACEDTLSLLQIPQADMQRGRRREQKKRKKATLQTGEKLRQASTDSGSNSDEGVAEKRRFLLKEETEEEVETRGGKQVKTGRRRDRSSRSRSPSSHAHGRDEGLWRQRGSDDESQTSTEEAEEEEPRYPHIFPRYIQSVYSSRENVSRLLRRALDRRLRGKTHRLRASSASPSEGPDEVDRRASDECEASRQSQGRDASGGASHVSAAHTSPSSDDRRGRCDWGSTMRSTSAFSDWRDGIEVRTDSEGGEEPATLGNTCADLETRGRSQRSRRPSPSRRAYPAGFHFDAWNGGWPRRAGAASEPLGRRQQAHAVSHAVSDRPWIEQRFKRPSCLALDRQLYVDVHTQSTRELLRELDEGAGRREARTLRCCPLSATGLFHSASCDVCLVGNQRAILDCPQLLERLVDLLALQVLPLPACLSGLTCGNMPGAETANALIQRLSQSTTPLFEEALGLSSLSSSSSSSASPSSAAHAVRSSPHDQRDAGAGQAVTSSMASASQPVRSQNQRTVNREGARTLASHRSAGSLARSLSLLEEGMPDGDSPSRSDSGPPLGASQQPAGGVSSRGPGGSAGPSVWRRLSSFVTGTRSSREDLVPASDASASSSSTSWAEHRGSEAERNAPVSHAPENSTGIEGAASQGPGMGQVSATITFEFTPEGWVGPASSAALGDAAENPNGWGLASPGGPGADGPAATPAVGGDTVAAPAVGGDLYPDVTFIAASSEDVRTAAEEGLSVIPTFVPSPPHRPRTVRVIREPVRFPGITFPFSGVAAAPVRDSNVDVDSLPASPSVTNSPHPPARFSVAPAVPNSVAEAEAEIATVLAEMGGFVWLPSEFRGTEEDPATILPVTAAGNPIVYLPANSSDSDGPLMFWPCVLILPRPRAELTGSPAGPGPRASVRETPGTREATERGATDREETAARLASSGASPASGAPSAAVNRGSSAADYLWSLFSRGSNSSAPSVPEPSAAPLHQASSMASPPSGPGSLVAAHSAQAASVGQAPQSSFLLSSFPASVPALRGGAGNASASRTVVQVMVQAAVTPGPGSEELFSVSQMGTETQSGLDAALTSRSGSLPLTAAASTGQTRGANASGTQPPPAGARRSAVDGAAGNSTEALTPGGTSANRWTFVPEVGWMASSGAGGTPSDLAAGLFPADGLALDFSGVAAAGAGSLSDLAGVGDGLSTTLWTTEDLEDLSFSLQAGGEGGAHQGNQRDLEQLQRVFDQAFEGYRSQRRAVKREERAARERRRERRRLEKRSQSCKASAESETSVLDSTQAAERLTQPAREAAPVSTGADAETGLRMKRQGSVQGTHATDAHPRPSSSSSSASSSSSSSAPLSSSSSSSSSSPPQRRRRRPRRSWFVRPRGMPPLSAHVRDAERAGSAPQSPVSFHRSRTSPASPQRSDEREAGPGESGGCMRYCGQRQRRSGGRYERRGTSSSTREPHSEETEKRVGDDTEATAPEDGNVFSRILRRLSSSFFSISGPGETQETGDSRETAADAGRCPGRAEGPESRIFSAAFNAAVEEARVDAGGDLERAKRDDDGFHSLTPGAFGKAAPLFRGRPPDGESAGMGRDSGGRGERGRQRLQAALGETEKTLAVDLIGEGPTSQASPSWASAYSLSPFASSSPPCAGSGDASDGVSGDEGQGQVSVPPGQRRTREEERNVCSSGSLSSGSLRPSSSLSSSSYLHHSPPSLERGSFTNFSAENLQDNDSSSLSEALPGASVASSLTSTAPAGAQKAECRPEVRGKWRTRRGTTDAQRGHADGLVGRTGDRRMNRDGSRQPRAHGDREGKARTTPESGLTERERVRMRRYILRLERRKRMEETEEVKRAQVQREAGNSLNRRRQTGTNTPLLQPVSSSGGDDARRARSREGTALDENNGTTQPSQALPHASGWALQEPSQGHRGALEAERVAAFVARGSSDSSGGEHSEGDGRDENPSAGFPGRKEARRLSSGGSTKSNSSRSRSGDSSRERGLSLSWSSAASLTSTWSSSSDSSFMSTSTEDEADETIKLLRLERKALPSDFELFSSLTARRRKRAAARRRKSGGNGGFTPSSSSNALNFFKAPHRRRPVSRAPGDTDNPHAVARRRGKKEQGQTRKEGGKLGPGSAGQKREAEGTHGKRRRHDKDRQSGSGKGAEEKLRGEAQLQRDGRQEGDEGTTVPPSIHKREYGGDEDRSIWGGNAADDIPVERADRDNTGKPASAGSGDRSVALTRMKQELRRAETAGEEFRDRKRKEGEGGDINCVHDIDTAMTPSFSTPNRVVERGCESPLSNVDSIEPILSTSIEQLFPSSSTVARSSSSSSRLPPFAASSGNAREAAAPPRRSSASCDVPREAQRRCTPAPSHRPSPTPSQPPNPSSGASVAASSSSSSAARGPGAPTSQAAGSSVVFSALPEAASNIISFVPTFVGEGGANALAALGGGQIGTGATGTMSVDFMLATALSALAQAAARSNNEWLHVLLNGLVQHFASPNRTYVLRIAGLCQHQPEQFFVICGLLAGRFRNEVQQRLNQLGFLPLLSQLFDTLVWFAPVPARRERKKTHGKGTEGECESERDGDRDSRRGGEARRRRHRKGGEGRGESLRQEEEQRERSPGEDIHETDPLKLACESSLCGLTVEFLRVIHDVCDFESGTVASVTKRQLLTFHEKNMVMHSLRRIRRVDKSREGRPPCCVRVVRRRTAVVHPHPMMCVSHLAQEREDRKNLRAEKQETPEKRRSPSALDASQDDAPESDSEVSAGGGKPMPLALDSSTSPAGLTSDASSPAKPDAGRSPSRAASRPVSHSSSASSSPSSPSSGSFRSSSRGSSPPVSPREDACTGEPPSDGGGSGTAGVGPGSVHQSDEQHARVMTRYVFKGTCGLLTKLIAVYASESCASVYKFWLASSIEACIRGGDPLLKIFAAERGLLHVLLRDIVRIAGEQVREQRRQDRKRMQKISAKRRAKRRVKRPGSSNSLSKSDDEERDSESLVEGEEANATPSSSGRNAELNNTDFSDDADSVDASLSPLDPSSVHRGILQSCCDLLGELIKFNPHVLHMLNAYLAARPQTLALFLNVLVGSLVDSNVLLRSLFLTIDFCRQVQYLHRQIVETARRTLRDAPSVLAASALPHCRRGAGPGLVGPREAALVMLPARLLRVMKVLPQRWGDASTAVRTDLRLSLPPPVLPPPGGFAGDGRPFSVSPSARQNIQMQALEAALNDSVGLPSLTHAAPLAFPPRPSILRTRYAPNAFGASPYSRGPSLAAAAAAAAALAAGPDDDMGHTPMAQRDIFGLHAESPSERTRASRAGDNSASSPVRSLSQAEVDEALGLLKKELMPLWRAVHIFERNANNPYALHASEDPAGKESGAASPRALRGAQNAVAATARSLASRGGGGGGGEAVSDRRKGHCSKTKRRQGDSPLLTCDRFGMPHQFSDCCVRGWHAAPSGLSLPFIEGPSLRSLLARSKTEKRRSSRQQREADPQPDGEQAENGGATEVQGETVDTIPAQECEGARGDFDALRKGPEKLHGPCESPGESRRANYAEEDRSTEQEEALRSQASSASLGVFLRDACSPFPASVDLAEAAAKGEYWEHAPLREARTNLRVEVSAAMADSALKKCSELHAVFRTKYAVDIEDVVPEVGSEAEAQRPLFLFARLQRTALIKKLMCVVPFDTVAPDTVCCVNSCLLLLLLALLDGELEETLETVRRDLAAEEDGDCPVLARQARGDWPSPPASWTSSSSSSASSAVLFRICRDAGNVPTLTAAAHARCRSCFQAALERAKGARVASREKAGERREARRQPGNLRGAASALGTPPESAPLQPSLDGCARPRALLSNPPSPLA
ncbi:hypothetical protein TGMAS_264790 [Toxoplasma gondii MAS]|uniref:Uncharacterized protein n=1 Tax=Toxoplasma gondii MAS TaxID=943118 RepID=A0A086PYR8_TOXGO|nr:hypothetical protein TGMAS_264790 [Toxoplasma gondii MAS]